MNAQPEPGQQNLKHILVYASMNDVQYLAGMLRGINFAARAGVLITKSGMVVTVEDARTLLGTAYIFAEVFDDFKFDETHGTPSQTQQTQDPDVKLEPRPRKEVSFEIPLATLVDCLNIFGTNPAKEVEKKPRFHRLGASAIDEEDQQREGGPHQREQAGRGDQHSRGPNVTGVRITYVGPGHPLEFTMNDPTDGALATVELTTFDPEPALELPFDSDRTVLKIILKSSWLRDALSELDTSSEKLTIIGNPAPPPGRAQRGSAPRLRLKAVGTFGSTEMDYPNDREVLETCECDDVVNFSYSFKHIVKAVKALQISTKTSLRIDEQGLLSMQFLMPEPKTRGGGPGDAFIEFRCLPLEEGFP
ncbi:Rad1-domain-containing protein [Phanerochaete sordida]|uniref:Rad1-domain-containing protein n=1 Tax=Phanerochaete sordida TaxID=48140 RepID=A0A9P3LNQ0_9APHY|nr:Rad1-domain-containing protein [Phanerochaete sordida]